MSAEPSVKDVLHRLIDEMSAEEAEGLLEQLDDDDELTPEEEEAVAEARAQIARGEFVTQEEIERKYGL